MKNKGTKVMIAGLALALAAGVASAQSSGSVPNNTVRVGVYFVTYDVHATDLSGPYTPPGLGSDLKNVQTPYFAYVRRLSPHFDLEVAAGIPPKTEAVAKGPATVGSVPFDGQTVLTARWLSPTVLFNYKFGSESNALRPYVGVGINHTRFLERRSTAAGNAIAGGPTSIDLPDSNGWAATAGLSYRLKNSFSLYVSYSMSKVTSDLTATTGGIERTSHIDFRPRTLVLSVGYSF